MAIWPQPGVTGEQLQQLLQQAAEDLGNRASQTMPTDAIVEVYLRWAVDAADNLRDALGQEDLDALVLTPEYWATRANPSRLAPFILAANTAVKTQKRALEAAAEEVQQQVAFFGPDQFSRPAVFFVPDTNVLLEHPAMYDELDWHGFVKPFGIFADSDLRVVLPMLVIDELDDAKRRDRTKTRARLTLKRIYEQVGSRASSRHSFKLRKNLHGEVAIQVMLDNPRHLRLPRPDDELIDRAVALHAFVGRDVYFVTYDTGAALRATAAGLKTLRLEHTG